MDFLLYLAAVPALGLSAQWIAWRTNLPSILLLLVFGMLLGQFVHPDEMLIELTHGDALAGTRILFPLVSLSVAVIMFEGGLSLKLSELKESGTAVLRLCTLGGILTWIGSAVAAHLTLGFDWRLSTLLGAILVVTGPTVIGPLLRQVRPSRRVANTLKWEGIVIDPVGAVLAILVFEQLLVHPDDIGIASTLTMLIKTLATGGILGAAGGWILTVAFRRYLVPDHLHGVFALAVSLLLFAISDQIAHESGLITVTVLGIWLANQSDLDVEHVIEFKEHLRTLLIGCLFIVLGSRVQFSDVTAIGWPGVLFVAILVVLIRPASVMISLWRNPIDFREKLFIASLAPRGIVAAAVSSVFALNIEQLSDAVQLPGSEQLATVTFLVIVGTVMVYGIGAAPIARRLGLASTNNNGVLIAGADQWVRRFADQLKQAGIPILMVDSNYSKISQARIEGLPAICANILNEHVRDELPLSGIGKMMAMTANDEVNSLAIRECRNLFGRADGYQLPFDESNRHHRRGMTTNLMGRALFAPDATFSNIEKRYQDGANFERIPLTESLSYDQFRQSCDEDPLLMCAMDDRGTLWINCVDDPLEPIAGQTVLVLAKRTSRDLVHEGEQTALSDEETNSSGDANGAG